MTIVIMLLLRMMRKRRRRTKKQRNKIKILLDLFKIAISLQDDICVLEVCGTFKTREGHIIYSKILIKKWSDSRVDIYQAKYHRL